MKKILACLLAMLLLCGCTMGKNPYVPTGDGLFVDVTTAPNRVEDLPTEQKLTLSFDPGSTLNPYTDTDPANRMLFGLLYQGLFAVDASYKAHPVICKDFTVSRDMKTYTFSLEMATFPDGTVVTETDVLASLEAARVSPVYGGRFTNIGQITATTDGDIQIQLTTPYENLPILLDIPIVKAHQVAAAWPDGTGPYYKTQGLSGHRLTRRTDWWCRANMAVTASVIPLVESDTPVSLRDDFEFGAIGLVCADPGTDSYVDFRCDYELWGCENGIFLYLACNEKSKVLSDPALRAALTYAIDRESLVTRFYGDFASAASLPASPQSPHYSEKLAKQYAYDPDKYQQLVTEANGSGKEVTLLVNSADSRRIRVAHRIAEMLSVSGLRVTVKALRDNSYTNALAKGNYDLHLGQTKLSPNMDLTPFFAPNGSLNYGSLSDAGIYSLCQEALANAGNYYTLHQKVMQSGMLIPILFRSYAIYTQRGLFTELTPAKDFLFYHAVIKN